MTIEAKLDQTNELLRALLAKFTHIESAAVPQPAKPAPASSPQKAEQKPAGGASEAKTPSYDQVKAAGINLAKKKPGTALQDLLQSEFNIDHANKLKPDQYASFIEKANQAAAAK